MGTLENIVAGITLLAAFLSFIGVLTIISMLHYEQQQKKHSAHIEKEIVNQESKAFKQKVEELKRLVNKQQLGTAALVKNSSEEALVKKPQHEKQPQLEKQVKKARGRKTIPVLVIDEVTNEKKLYDSIEAFAREKGLNVSTCRSAKYKGHMLKKRYFID